MSSVSRFFAPCCVADLPLSSRLFSQSHRQVPEDTDATAFAVHFNCSRRPRALNPVHGRVLCAGVKRAQGARRKKSSWAKMTTETEDKEAFLGGSRPSKKWRTRTSKMTTLHEPVPKQVWLGFLAAALLFTMLHYFNKWWWQEDFIP